MAVESLVPLKLGAFLQTERGVERSLGYLDMDVPRFVSVFAGSRGSRFGEISRVEQSFCVSDGLCRFFLNLRLGKRLPTT
jgi:hypothetical protein